MDGPGDYEEAVVGPNTITEPQNDPIFSSLHKTNSNIKRRLPYGRSSQSEVGNVTATNVDVESQSKKNEYSSRVIGRSVTSIDHALVTSTPKPATSIFGKIVTLLAEPGEEDATQSGGIAAVLRDYIISIILGVITVSIVMTLDHRHIVHFQHAHNFRNAAFQLLSDPETIKSMEESWDIKLMTLVDHKSKLDEINGAAETIARLDKIFQKRRADAEEKKKEVEAIKDEYDSLMESPLLDLNLYCGHCVWGGKKTCDARVHFLQDTYNTRLIPAKLSAMGKPSCKKEE